MSDQPEEFQARSAEYPPLSLQPVYFFYAVVLTAIYILNLGLAGLMLALIVLTFWAFVFTSRNRPRSLSIAIGIVFVFSVLIVMNWVIAFLIFLLAVYVAYFYAYRYHQPSIQIGILIFLLNLVLFYFLLPRVVTYKESSWYSQCRSNLKQLGLALHNYHDTYRCFPPAYVADEEGKPLHSWRVLLLPYIDQAPLYREYNFDEPWDGPNNSKLHNRVVRAYVCPSDPNNRGEKRLTNYLAVVDDRTAWPGAKPTSIKDFTDSTSNTILLVEMHGQNIHWMEPHDLTLKAAVDYLATTDEDVVFPHPVNDRYYKKASRCFVLLADGSVKSLTHGLERNLVESLLLLQDGLLSSNWYDPIAPKQLRRLRTEVIIGWVFAVLITLWPLPWVWWNPHSEVKSIREEPAPEEYEST